MVLSENLQEELPEAKDIKTYVEERHIREWNSELRKNNLFMDKQNLERKTTKLKKDFKLREAEQSRKENSIMQEQREMFKKQKSLYSYEQDLIEKEMLLQIKMDELKVEDFQPSIDPIAMSRRIYYIETENESSKHKDSQGKLTKESVAISSSEYKKFDKCL